MMLSLLLRRCLALLALAAAVPAFAAVDESQLLPIDEAFALTASAPSREKVEFTWKIAEGYYLYRHRMSAVPEAAGFTVGELALPQGIQRTDEFFGEVETYRAAVTATLPLVASGDSQVLRFKVRYQGCADVGICYPPHQKIIEVALPPAQGEASFDEPFLAGAGASSLLPNTGTPSLFGGDVGGDTPASSTEELPLPAEEAFQFEAIAVSPVELLLRFTPAPGYYLYRDRSSLALRDSESVALATPQWPPSQAHHDEHFGDVAVYFNQIEVPLPLRRSRAEAMALTLEATFQGCQTDGICYPPMTRQVRIELPQAAAEQLVSTPALKPSEAAAQATGGQRGGVNLWLAIALALGGGLILNLMPCVLPVLSLKALGLAQSGESHSHARAHALWYTAGVLVSFLALGAAVLALRKAGLALGWGFQLQQPLVVAALVYVIAAVGLSLSGVFSIGAGWAGAGEKLTRKSGAAGDFFTGVLAVVVASPCTAPFMGTAMAFAFASGTVAALVVFAALGLGLALPFLLIGFVPSLAKALPRPGAWMESLKQILAFPMYLTAVWLLWVLGRQLGVDAMAHVLAGVAVLALALWCWEKARWAGSLLKRLVAVALLALALWPLAALRGTDAQAPVSAAEPASAWSQARLDELRAAGRTVFVNMTADWCVTCKANEKRVLATEAFRAALDAADAQYLVGDWTHVDPAITAFLEAHGAVGVPLYVVFHGQAEGIVLPTVLTQAAVDAALAESAR